MMNEHILHLCAARPLLSPPFDDPDAVAYFGLTALPLSLDLAHRLTEERSPLPRGEAFADTLEAWRSAYIVSGGRAGPGSMARGNFIMRHGVFQGIRAERVARALSRWWAAQFVHIDRRWLGYSTGVLPRICHQKIENAALSRTNKGLDEIRSVPLVGLTALLGEMKNGL